eukprot:16397796-Heterocapsa_arctica.AAC.1
MGVASIGIEPALSEGMDEDFYRFWALPREEGDMHSAARGPGGALAPLDRLVNEVEAHLPVEVDLTYEPFMLFKQLKY